MQTPSAEESTTKRWYQPVINAFIPSADRGWRGIPSQFVLVGIAAVLYFFVRMITGGSEADAYANAQDLLHFEESIGVAWEFTAQQWVLGNRAVVTFFNWVYIWLHWPVIVGALVWLYCNNRSQYLFFRNALFVSGAIGLVFFVSFPLAPPRFLDGFTDTVSTLSTSYQYLQPPGIVNKYAAMPSLHVGWNILAGVAVFRAVKVGPLRAMSVISPLLMTLAVVFTANHYVIDAVMGAVVAGIGILGARFIDKRMPEQLAHTPRSSSAPSPVAA